MLRSIAELAAYGTLAALLAMASVTPPPGEAMGSATTTSTSATTDLATSAAAAPAGTGRGALLFAAKGCVGCHTHAAFPQARIQIGPDLTDLAGRAADRIPGMDARDYVRQSMRAPSAFVVPGYAEVMPDLSLTDEQIASLTTFLLSPRG